MIPLFDRLTRGFMSLLGVALLAMIALSLCNVVGRYLFNAAILWADEAAVFGMIALTWLGAIVCDWRNAEIRMDILANALPASAQRWLHVAQQALIAVLCGWIAWTALAYVRRLWTVGITAEATGMKMWIIHATIPFSLAVIALIAVIRGLRLIAGRGGDLAAVKKVEAPLAPSPSSLSL